MFVTYLSTVLKTGRLTVCLQPKYYNIYSYIEAEIAVILYTYLFVRDAYPDNEHLKEHLYTSKAFTSTNVELNL